MLLQSWWDRFVASVVPLSSCHFLDHGVPITPDLKCEKKNFHQQDDSLVDEKNMSSTIITNNNPSSSTTTPTVVVVGSSFTERSDSCRSSHRTTSDIQNLYTATMEIENLKTMVVPSPTITRIQRGQKRTIENHTKVDPVQCQHQTTTTTTRSTTCTATDLPSKRYRSQKVSPSPSRPSPATGAVSSRRRSRGMDTAIEQLASHIVLEKKNVVFITGAGLSVASGVRPFRSSPQALVVEQSDRTQPQMSSGLWEEVIWTMSTRKTVRTNPLVFYNQYWLPYFVQSSVTQARPNCGHKALDVLLQQYHNVKQITQNIDGLQASRPNRLIEVHGHAGLFKCCPDSDSDNDDSDDSDDERPVHLGHRRKHKRQIERLLFQKNTTTTTTTTTKNICPYQTLRSLTREEVVHAYHPKESSPISTVPSCPYCGNTVMPQALLFDEGYHSHSYYQFEMVEDWISQANVLVFVGTRLGAVLLTKRALEHARTANIPVYNFNLYDKLQCTSRLNVTNIIGPASQTLSKLNEVCDRLLLKNALQDNR